MPGSHENIVARGTSCPGIKKCLTAGRIQSILYYIMQQPFREYLRKYNSPEDLKGESFDSFTQRLVAYIEECKKKGRKELPDSLEVGRKLRDLGAPMESYKILKHDAAFYRNRGDMNKYWRQLYFSGAFANLGYPSKTIEAESKRYCALLRKKRTLLPFLPLFLNTYAGILHVYREDFGSANNLYREAIPLLEAISPRTFERTVGKEYLWAYKLILNNYLDSLFMSEKTRENEEEIKRVMDIAQSKSEKTDSEYIKILTVLNQAEMKARTGEARKADQILKHTLSHAGKEMKRYIRPAYYRIAAIILAHEGNEGESVKYMLRAFAESRYYGNTLEETLTIRDSLSNYNLLANKAGVKDRYRFFKKNGLFDYLLQVLEIKDWFLGTEHSVNVSETAVGIASILSLKPAQLRLTRIASLLHDIGKIVIPWYSLNKISPLDQLDWEILKAHTTEGGTILRKLGLNREATIVENHHERIDGSGYPKGLKHISLEQEIVAVSDVFNAAITPNRKYKTPKTHQEAIHEISARSFSSLIITALAKYLRLR